MQILEPTVSGSGGCEEVIAHAYAEYTRASISGVLDQQLPNDYMYAERLGPYQTALSYQCLITLDDEDILYKSHVSRYPGPASHTAIVQVCPSSRHLVLRLYLLSKYIALPATWAD